MSDERPAGPRNEVRARRTPFGRRAVRRGRAAAPASGPSERTEANGDSTVYTRSHAYTRTRTARRDDEAEGRQQQTRILWIRAKRGIRSIFDASARWFASTVTGLGRSLAVLVVLCAVFGYLLGWLELVVVAFTGLALIVLGVFFLIGRNAYDVGLSLDRDRVVVGEAVAATLTVSNPSRFTLPPVSAEVPVGQGLAAFHLGGIPSGGRAARMFSVPTSRRGVIRVGPVRTVRGDPVGLVRREYEWTAFLELFVHPSTTSIPATSTGLIRDLEGNPTRDLTDSDVSFHALREYAPGDDRRHIHWKSTARTGQLMVRQFEETRRSHLVVVLSLASADYLSEEEFELAVSVAGSLGIRAIRDARDVTVLASEVRSEFGVRGGASARRLRTVSRTRLLDDLASVQHADLAAGLVELARGGAESVSGASVAFMVCGSVPRAHELRAASTAFGAGVEVLVIVCNPGIVPSMRRIGELRVLTIGYLDDLQKSLARAAR
ncbi:DUF58 domain-containing protein [Agreia sp. COWG]|uniref:DUF58 domain-containing protein n=1 Tax=Agreia sp. COWG TaxID=2773266 RepID=UPI00192732C5|nr:DUF58 domain-containing protein [Agreia sp. COWG]CAD6004733.1 conserved protein of unknown function [Agreia sp. COWG]